MPRILNKKNALHIIKDLEQNTFDNIKDVCNEIYNHDASLSLHLNSLSHNNGDLLFDMLLRNESTKVGNILYNKNSSEFLFTFNNAKKLNDYHIYIRQSFKESKRNYIMLDDINKDSVLKMFNIGFDPVIVNETSTNNYQAVLQFSKYHDIDFIIKAHFILKLAFNADMLCDYNDHFMRLTQSINIKEKYKGTNKYNFKVKTVFANTFLLNNQRSPFKAESIFLLHMDKIKNFVLNDQPEVLNEILKRKCEYENNKYIPENYIIQKM